MVDVSDKVTAFMVGVATAFERVSGRAMPRAELERLTRAALEVDLDRVHGALVTALRETGFPVSTFEEIAGELPRDVPKGTGASQLLAQFLESPEFRAWVNAWAPPKAPEGSLPQ